MVGLRHGEGESLVACGQYIARTVLPSKRHPWTGGSDPAERAEFVQAPDASRWLVEICFNQFDPGGNKRFVATFEAQGVSSCTGPISISPIHHSSNSPPSAGAIA